MVAKKQKKHHKKLFSRAGTEKQTRSLFGNAVLFIILAAFAAFMILPLFYSVINSFKPIEELFLYPPRFYVMRPVFSNYTSLFRLINNLRVPFSRYAFNSVFVCVVITAGQILLASTAAYSLSKFKTRISWFFPVVVTSLLFNSTVLAIPQYIILNALGIVNTYWVYILPSLASSLGLFLMKQFMEQVPGALIEAAKIDGASHFTIYWKIVMPLVKPAWLTLLLYAFQGIWATSSGSTVYNEEFKLLPNAINQVLSGTIERTGASAAGNVLLMIPPILVFILTQSNVIQTMTSSGIKE